MVELDYSAAPRNVLIIRLYGFVSTVEFSALPEFLLNELDGGLKAKILFDWRSLDNSSLLGWSVVAMEPWIVVVHRIERIAIVHDPGWNRHAALLAALLRRENLNIRSWRPEHLSTAFDWLLQL